MPSWNSEQYLKFEAERTRPCQDLVARIPLVTAHRIVDLGCGPGNSTRVLAERWPGAELWGLDSSPEMIASAMSEAAKIDATRQGGVRGTFELADLRTWQPERRRYDLLFSNAALQWVPDHGTVLPRLWEGLAAGGWLAMQVPYNLNAPAHRAARELAGSGTWKGKFPAGGVREWHVPEREFYYDLLAPRGAELDLWQTTYLHVLPDHAAIVEWYRGTGLRPYLDRLSAEDQRGFLADYGREIARAYPQQIDGRVILPFERLFVLARRM
jgi:trans-aconitate 2-methyltransferase